MCVLHMLYDLYLYNRNLVVYFYYLYIYEYLAIMYVLSNCNISHCFVISTKCYQATRGNFIVYYLQFVHYANKLIFIQYLSSAINTIHFY